MSYLVGILEQLLFADCGDEFLEVEWLEVGYIAEFLVAERLKGRGKHCGCFGMALAEAGVGMSEHICAFAGSVAYEKAWPLF